MEIRVLIKIINSLYVFANFRTPSVSSFPYAYNRGTISYLLVKELLAQLNLTNVEGGLSKYSHNEIKDRSVNESTSIGPS